MTARKAVTLLLKKGLLERGEGGRLVVRNVPPPNSDKSQKAAKKTTGPSTTLAFALPAHGSASTEFDRWRVAAENAAARLGLSLRTVHFHHWDDPILSDALDSFPGLFLLPPAERIPPELVTRIRESKARVVALDTDLTSHGIRSIDLVPPSSILRLLDHLTGLGHRTIHCVNSQPMDLVIEQRIGQWELWRVAQGCKGELLNDPEESYGHPIKKAHQIMSRRLKQRPLEATALVCLTMPAALGVTRALYEHKLVLGKDVSLCAANDEGLASYLCPSITATQMPDPAPYLTLALQWMTGASYGGPLLNRPAEVPLFLGESTRPPSK